MLKASKFLLFRTNMNDLCMDFIFLGITNIHVDDCHSLGNCGSSKLCLCTCVYVSVQLFSLYLGDCGLDFDEIYSDLGPIDCTKIS